MKPHPGITNEESWKLELAKINLESAAFWLTKAGNTPKELDLLRRNLYTKAHTFALVLKKLDMDDFYIEEKATSKP